MSTIDEIEKAVAALEPQEFARFLSWFDSLAANRFDEAIADDVSRGRLDGFAEQALDDVREGRARPL